MIEDMSHQVEITVGRVSRPHGLKGQVSIELHTDEPARRFFPGVSLTMDDGREVVVETVTWQRGRLLVTFADVPDRTAVETLRGRLLTTTVSADEQPSQPDEYFDRQLVGLAVVDGTGQRHGQVAQVLHMPAQEVLLVALDAGGEAMVPFVAALVPEVDIAGARVTVADVEGLLEAQ